MTEGDVPAGSAPQQWSGIFDARGALAASPGAAALRARASVLSMSEVLTQQAFFSQVGAFSVKQAFLHENPLLESRIMRSAASGGVGKARTSKIAPA